MSVKRAAVASVRQAECLRGSWGTNERDPAFERDDQAVCEPAPTELDDAVPRVQGDGRVDPRARVGGVVSDGGEKADKAEQTGSASRQSTRP